MRITLSTASTYPDSTESTFEVAARLGFDGVEVMVGTDARSQDVDGLRRLSDRYQLPVTSLHAPCLLISQRVWGTEPWGKLVRSRQAAQTLGASVVVVHPPFRWQRDYARSFVEGVARMQDETDVKFAVENMFPWRAPGLALPAYAPAWDVREHDYHHLTLDLSHTAVSGSDAIRMAADFGSRLAHVHLADGSGSARDEHLVPGRGTQPCAEVLSTLARTGFAGDVVVEISTRKVPDRDTREADLRESLAFARKWSGR